jgi:phage terminase large subunit
LIQRPEIARVFLPLLQPKRFKGAYGGRGGAKSHFFAEQTVIRTYPEPKRILCIREVQKSIRDSVYNLIVQKIDKFEARGFYTITQTEIRGANGSEVIFAGMQDMNAETLKSIEGVDYCWVEEAQTLSAKSLRILIPTIRKKGSELWFSWNPRFADDPVDEFFRGEHPHPDSIAVAVGWQDNPWFHETELERDKDHDYAKDADMAEHVWGGAYQVISEGAYYARLLLQADKDGRIASLPHNPALPVYTAWDLGVGDDTSIWFAQRSAGWIHVIDHYATNGQAAAHYVDVLKKKPYVYAKHILPHDADNREWSHGQSRIDTLRSLGLPNLSVLSRIPIDDGINAARLLLPVCRFDGERCKSGLESLRQYRREYDENKRTFKPTPLHDWTSHDADAFRYLAMGLEPDAAVPPDIPKYSRRRRDGNTDDESWMTA